MCIELTQKYLNLEKFRFQTQIENLQYQICFVQEEKIQAKKNYEQK
jgi:hypothetical protein